MKYFILSAFILAFSGSLVFAGGGSQDDPAPTRLIPSQDDPAPVPGESDIVIINKIKADSVMIYVDGLQKVHILAGEIMHLTVPDGKHEVKGVQLKWNKRNGTWSEKGDDTRTVQCKAETVVIEVTSDPDVDIQGRSPIAYNRDGEQRTPAPAKPRVQPGTSSSSVPQSSLETALYAAADLITAKMSAGSTVAVLSVAAIDKDSAEWVVDELAYVIVNKGYLKVVDRKSLDAIRSEQKFQMTGEVDDDSAVSIGKLLGANLVITGSISGIGSTRRLRLKVLDVKTAQILAMASEAF